MGHWHGVYFGDEHPPPPPRWPWLRDVILAVPIGAMIGGSVGFWITRGFWPVAAAIGLTAFVLHAGILGLGQLSDHAKLRSNDLRIITLAGASSVVLTMLIAWIATA